MNSPKSFPSTPGYLLARWPLFLLPAVSMPTLVTWHDSLLGLFRGMFLVACVLVFQRQLLLRREAPSAQTRPWPWPALFGLMLFMAILASTGGLFLLALTAVSLFGAWLRHGRPDWYTGLWTGLGAGLVVHVPMVGFSCYETTTLGYTVMIAGVFVSAYVQYTLFRAWVAHHSGKAKARLRSPLPVAGLVAVTGVMLGLSEVSILGTYSYLAGLSFPLWTLIPWAVFNAEQKPAKLARLARIQFWTLLLNGVMLVFVTRHWALLYWFYQYWFYWLPQA